MDLLLASSGFLMYGKVGGCMEEVIKPLTDRVDRLEKRQDKVEERVGRLEQGQAANIVEIGSIKGDIAEIKEGQKWATRYTLGTLITVILAILGFWVKFVR
ncbi:MAG: hemolysin XhlA family protein [Firmicutes bacterium]|nr:hemolysin XhlA family protein [Bacillota bacterium]